MTPFADLHIHTYFSDSTSSPEEVVDQSLTNGLRCIAITDHDTFDGVIPTRDIAQRHSLEVITAIELSSETDARDIHVLGYFFDGVGQALLDKLEKIQDGRVRRMAQMIEKLNALGMKGITLEEILSLTKSKSVGRLHLATVLQQKGFVGSIPEAFHRLIGEGKPAYAEKFKLMTTEAIKLIKDSGGLAVLAHPLITNRDELIPGFVQAGLDGLEVYYPRYSSATTVHYENLAQKHKLLRTGGSDAHGQAKQDTFIGKTKIPYDLVEAMRDYARRSLAW